MNEINQIKITYNRISNKAVKRVTALSPNVQN